MRIRKLHNIAENNIMQRLYKNENLFIQGLTGFLLQKQHIPIDVTSIVFIRAYLFRSLFDVQCLYSRQPKKKGKEHKSPFPLTSLNMSLYNEL